MARSWNSLRQKRNFFEEAYQKTAEMAQQGMPPVAISEYYMWASKRTEQFYENNTTSASNYNGEAEANIDFRHEIVEIGDENEFGDILSLSVGQARELMD
jgi:hypothetical protein